MRALGIAVSLLAVAAFACSGDDEPPPDEGLEFCELVADGTECDDGDRCTLADACRSGVCVGGDLVTCNAPDACHLAGICDPATGVCDNPARRDGAECDDGDACTQVDECRAGVCTGMMPVVCRQLGACRVAGECDAATGLCSHPFADDDTLCDDGDPCTVEDSCQSGVCTAGGPRDCGAADACGGAGRCDETTGECTRDLEPDGTTCDDGDLCTIDDACRAGVCTGGGPRACVASNPCQVVTGCAPDTGCLVTNHADGAPCSDGDACTASDHCIAGVCSSTTSVTCSALDQCHDAGVCDPSTGCSHPPKPNGVPCLDGSLCTLTAACDAGVCTAVVTAECPPAPQVCLQNGVCNPSTGACEFAGQPDGTACNDANVCTGSDVCVAGACEGTLISTGVLPCEDGICFSTVTATVGIAFNTVGAMMMGAGAAFLDVDGDGLLDIALSSESVGVRIYLNQGATFVDATAALNVAPYAAPDHAMGLTAADYDNDGDTDLYVTALGPNRLYRNDGGVLVDVTATAGVGDARWSTAAAFGDYDGDGDLDLYVGNYVAAPNFPFHTPYPNALYRNDGDGTFTDVSAAMGVEGAGTTLAVTWTDFDGDRDLDLFVCNDFGAFVQPNQLYRNDGVGFTNISDVAGFDVGIFCMGIAAADYDGDLDLDYYFSNLGRNVFLENAANTFVDVTVPTGTALATDQCRAPLLTTSWGVGFVDFDNDGAQELYVSNGYVPAQGPIANALDSPNALFLLGAPSTDIAESAGVDDRQRGRGVAFGDYDNDGDIDVLQANVVGDALLYRNDSPAQGAHLALDVEGRLSNRDGFGARVEATFGATTRVREVNANFSYQSSSDPRVYFGAGSAVIADRVRLRWPSGVTQTLYDVPTGMTVAVTEPAVTATIASIAPNPVAPGQTLNVTIGFANASSNATTVAWVVDFATASASGTIVVPGGGSASTVASVVVPAAASGAVDVTVTVTESGAVNQARGAVVVAP